ncbi:PREDICTED: condensin-2 complex subunit G2-like isoform X1 [Amphimedon queenslandica]|uniref:Uncharacterized protein n=1 Tax=Amphimedon queenslandica TaxID=400682 RepID=A0AAN0JBC1_AMPQE|nr:PREDICTED: condensin-2 complex subunit G2-like isoform X1 [Amphimedon queenslandica]|eukprot:XP_019854077.1 PREDICTED: condensin-2 complex subunit G2-like isoform X1 [Amphimedon queenslandica]
MGNNKMAGKKDDILKSISNASKDPSPFLSLYRSSIKPSRSKSISIKEFLQSLPSNDRELVWDSLLKLCSDTMDKVAINEGDGEEDSDTLVAVEGSLSEIVATFEGIVHWVYSYITNEESPVVSDLLLELAVNLHSFMLTFSEEYFKLTDSISLMCETWWNKDLRMKELLVTNTILFILAKAHNSTKVVDLKRLWSVRESFFLLDFEDESADSIKELLLKTLISPFFLKSPEGVKFISYTFTFDIQFTDVIHSVIKSMLPDAPKWVVEAYGKVYFRAWRISSGSLLHHIETHYLQDLIHLCIHAPRKGGGGRSPFLTLRRLLNQFHSEITQRSVQEVLYRLYKPLLWRSLRVASPDVRANALTLMLDGFPLYDPNYTKPEIDEEIQRQFNLMKELLMDQSVVVRTSCVSGVCHVLSYYWEMIPAPVISDIIRIIIHQLAFDTTSSDVRIAVLQGVGVVLDQRLSHRFLKEFLPVLKAHLHDRSERVRIAFLDLLILIKGLRAIKFWTICSIDQLLACIETGSAPVIKRTISLLMDTFKPKSSSSLAALNRCVVLVRSNPLSFRRFYFEALNYMTAKDIESFMTSLLKYIGTNIDGSDLTNANKSRARQDREKKRPETNHVTLNGVSKAHQTDSNDVETECSGHESDLCVAEVSHPLCDKEVLVSLLEVVVILMEGLRLKEKDAKDFKVIPEVKSLFPKLFEYFKDTRGCHSVYLIGSLLPKSVIGSLKIKTLCDILASSEANEDPLALLVTLSRFEQEVPVLELVRRGLETGLHRDGGGKENVSETIGGERRSRRSRRKKGRDKDGVSDYDGVIPSPSVALRILNHLMTHPALYSKVKDLSHFWELIPLLQTTFGHIEDQLTAIDTAASSTERFLVESVGTYIRMTAHSMTEHKSDDKEEFHKQLEEVLLWYEEKVIPLLSTSSEKWQQILKNNKTRKRRWISQSDEDGVLNSSTPHAYLIHSLIEALLTVLSDMLMCGLIGESMDVSVSQSAIKIIDSGGLISFGHSLSVVLYQLVEVGSYSEVGSIISPSSLLTPSMLLDKILSELRLIANDQPEAFKKLWSHFKPVLSRAILMSVYHQLLIVSLSSFPIFTSLAKATLSAHVEQLRLNTSMSIPTDISELPHYTSLLVDSACRTTPSGRLFVSHLVYDVEGIDLLTDSPECLFSALHIASSLTNKSPLNEELLRLVDTCLIASKTSMTSSSLTEPEYPDVIRNIQELALSVQHRLLKT